MTSGSRRGSSPSWNNIGLGAYDKMIGLEFAILIVDGCILKTLCGGEVAGQSPGRSQKAGQETLTTGGSQQHLIGLCCGTSELQQFTAVWKTLIRFGFDLPEQITVCLNTGYDSGKTRDLPNTLGCDGVISARGIPLQSKARWIIEHTNP